MHRAIGVCWVCFCAFITSHARAPGSNEAAAWKTYETSIGASQHIALTGGSSVQLNTSTQLRTFIAGPYRAVTLERGEAFFRVVGNPLHVNVGDLFVSGGDASFSVRNYGGGDVDVMALDGRIRIDFVPAKPPGSLPVARRVGWIVPAGQIATIRTEGVSSRPLGRANIERKLMWRDGMLEFVNETIENIAAEFNRYSRTKLVVDDDSIRNLRVGGRFSVFDLDTFVVTASKVFGLHPQTRQTASGAVVRLRLGQIPIPRTQRANASPTPIGTRASIEQ
jgi:transmembrane sensor